MPFAETGQPPFPVLVTARPAKQSLRQFRVARSRLTNYHVLGAQHGLDIGGHAAGTEPVSQQELGNEIEVVALGDIEIELEVLRARCPARRQCRVVSSDLFDIPPSDQGRSAADEISHDQGSVDIAAKIRRRDVEYHAVLFIDAPRPGVDQSNTGTTFAHQRNLLADLLWMPQIVAVDGRDKLSAPI